MECQPDTWPPLPPHPSPHPTLQHGFSAGIFPPQRLAKPSEKPRLRQIPSAEDLETDGGGVGPLGDDSLEHRESGHGQHEARGPLPLQQHQVWQCPSALRRCSQLMLGPGIDGRDGDSLLEQGAALRPTGVLPEAPVVQKHTHTWHVHACRHTSTSTRSSCLSGSG